MKAQELIMHLHGNTLRVRHLRYQAQYAHDLSYPYSLGARLSGRATFAAVAMEYGIRAAILSFGAKLIPVPSPTQNTPY